MLRAMGWVGCLAVAQGCVLYEKDAGRCREDEDTGMASADPRPGDPGSTSGPAAEPDPEPEPELFELALTPSTGEAGSTVLASLVVIEGTFDLAQISEVQFSGASVVVADQVARPDEILLVLDIAADAAPGSVDGFAVATDGQAWILPPFTITASSGCPATGGGSATGDTGCP